MLNRWHDSAPTFQNKILERVAGTGLPGLDYKILYVAFENKLPGCFNWIVGRLPMERMTPVFRVFPHEYVLAHVDEVTGYLKPRKSIVPVYAGKTTYIPMVLKQQGERDCIVLSEASYETGWDYATCEHLSEGVGDKYSCRLTVYGKEINFTLQNQGRNIDSFHGVIDV